MTTRAIAIVGAGMTGATLARWIAERGHPVDLFEARAHVAGNCHDRWDEKAACRHHVYGPHIFHTDDARVLDWIGRFTTLDRYRHSVKALTGGQVYGLPINLHTLNQFFGTAMTPAEARARLAALAEDVPDPEASFEARALSMLGRDLYETFFRHYTRKQWGIEPDQVPAAILKRLPVRFTYDDNYFHHTTQGLPRDGYTGLVEAMLDHPAIRVHLSQPVGWADVKSHARVFWTGALEEVFAADEGHLPYRTLDFDTRHEAGDVQGCAVINTPDPDVPHTRITQHNYLRPETRAQEPVTTSLISRETSRAWRPGDVRYYPVHMTAENPLLARYRARAAELPNLTLCGRLGGFRYIDMDVAIASALDLGQALYPA